MTGEVHLVATGELPRRSLATRLVRPPDPDAEAPPGPPAAGATGPPDEPDIVFRFEGAPR